VKTFRCLSWCVLALSLVPSLASADEQSLVDFVQRRVSEVLLKPLAKMENNRFSRARPPPHERRVRVTATATTPDKAGRPFAPFAVDIRYVQDEWQQNDIVGCAYPKTGELFVKIGDSYRPAQFLLGKNVEPVAGVCEAAPAAKS
jgi:hypothetical protein